MVDSMRGNMTSTKQGTRGSPLLTYSVVYPWIAPKVELSHLLAMAGVLILYVIHLK